MFLGDESNDVQNVQIVVVNANDGVVGGVENVGNDQTKVSIDGAPDVGDDFFWII